MSAASIYRYKGIVPPTLAAIEAVTKNMDAILAADPDYLDEISEAMEIMVVDIKNTMDTVYNLMRT